MSDTLSLLVKSFMLPVTVTFPDNQIPPSRGSVRQLFYTAPATAGKSAAEEALRPRSLTLRRLPSMITSWMRLSLLQHCQWILLHDVVCRDGSGTPGR